MNPALKTVHYIRKANQVTVGKIPIVKRYAKTVDVLWERHPYLLLGIVSFILTNRAVTKPIVTQKIKTSLVQEGKPHEH